MPRSVNEVRIAGNAGKDAVRYGNGPFKFSVATGGGKKKDGSGEWPTQWHTIVVWPNRVEGSESVRKGNFVEVEGRLEYESWNDKTSGEKKTQAVIVATSLGIGDSSEKPMQQRPLTPKPVSAPHYEPMGSNTEITDDDIPF